LPKNEVNQKYFIHNKVEEYEKSYSQYLKANQCLNHLWLNAQKKLHFYTNFEVIN